MKNETVLTYCSWHLNDVAGRGLKYMGNICVLNVNNQLKNTSCELWNDEIPHV